MYKIHSNSFCRFIYLSILFLGGEDLDKEKLLEDDTFSSVKLPNTSETILMLLCS